MRRFLLRYAFQIGILSLFLTSVVTTVTLTNPLPASAQTISGKGDAFMDFYSKFVRELKAQRTHLKGLKSKYQQINDITLLQATDQLIDINQEFLQLAESVEDLFFYGFCVTVKILLQNDLSLNACSTCAPMPRSYLNALRTLKPVSSVMALKTSLFSMMRND